MPRLVCYHCGRVKRCRMILGRLGVEYLCRPCLRELGYPAPSGARRASLDRSDDSGPKMALRGAGEPT